MISPVNENDIPYNTNMINEELNDDLDDAYVHSVVHAYKKFIFSGTGIRTLIDSYVYNKHFKDQLDGNYVQEQCTLLRLQNSIYKLELYGSKYAKAYVYFKDYFQVFPGLENIINS